MLHKITSIKDSFVTVEQYIGKVHVFYFFILVVKLTLIHFKTDLNKIFQSL